MSKKRQTRKEKLAASSRHDYSKVLTLSATRELTNKISIEEVRTAEPLHPQLPNPSHTYVAKDVRNTLLITATLILLDILIFYVLKVRLLSFKGITF